MRWLRLFTNKTFRKHLKLIFPQRDRIICIVSLAIFHPHFVIRIFPSPFYHPHFSIRHPPPSGPYFKETRKKVNMLFAGKLCPRHLGHFQALGHSFSLYGPTLSRQITYIYIIYIYIYKDEFLESD